MVILQISDSHSCFSGQCINIIFACFLHRANKRSFVSASRKTNDDDEGEGHKPDFIITINKRSGKFEVMFGLFKSPYKSSSHFANVDLVDLGVLLKDSLDYMYNEKRIELDMAVFGIHAFGM